MKLLRMMKRKRDDARTTMNIEKRNARGTHRVPILFPFQGWLQAPKWDGIMVIAFA